MAKGKKVVSVECTIEDALGYGPEISSLQEEMASWRDSMEEKLSHTEKYERVSEAADALENAELESRCDDLIDALRALSEGSPFVAGCPEHVVGRKCARCKWDGVAKKPHGHKQTIERFDPPKEETSTWSSWPGGGKGEVKTTRTEIVFGVIRHGNGSFSTYSIEKTSATEERIAEQRANFERAAALAEKENARLDTPYIPPRIEDRAEVFPIAALEDILDRKVSYSELEAYKGKSLSRADRLGNATGAIRTAVEAVRAALDALPEGAVAEDDDRIDDVREKLDEVESALDEVEAVEFPGMYG
jgi:hypothetical protein